MGCWNGTCALTNLPIREDDDVVLYVLAKNTEGNCNLENIGGGMVYSNDIYTPVGLPVYGKYNDYGSIKDIKNIAVGKLLVKAVLKDENLKSNTSFKSGDIYELIEAITNNHRDDENLKALNSVCCRGYAFLMFHRFAVDAMVKYDEECYSNCSSLKNRVEEFFKRRKAYGVHYNSLNDLKVTCEFANVLPENPKNIKELIRHMKFCESMNALRKSWIPPSGAGSQNTEYEIHMRLTEEVLKFIEEKKSQDEDEDY